MPKLVYIVTVPITARVLLKGQLAYFRQQGFDVTVITSPESDLEAITRSDRVQVLAVPMQREIHLWQDLVSFWRLYRALRKLDPDIVNASTAKAGFLGMLAAWLAQVPVRVYALLGLRLETLSGMKRRILFLTEWIAAIGANRVICVSTSLRTEYVNLGLSPDAKAIVLASGSTNGLDAERFLATSEMLAKSHVLREQLEIPENVSVIGFVGRLVRDKGIMELLDAFDRVLETWPQTYLLIVGPFEEGDPIPASYVQRLHAHPQVVLTGYVTDTAPYYHMMDVLAFPSFREGLPNVVLEAGAAGIPVVGCRVTGMVDAVVDGVTGMLVPAGDVKALADTLVTYLENPELRRKHGQAGSERVLRDFRQEVIWEALYKEYMRLLRERHIYGS